MLGKFFTLKGFTKRDFLLWGGSVALILTAFFVFDRENFLSPISSITGVTSLIFIAKGNPLGQALTIVFSVFYGIISFSFGYYGEMITYLGMTAPMAGAAMVSWIKNPYKESAEVSVNSLKLRELWIMLPIAAAVTAAFYFLLRTLGTANLLPSTVSVTTSFLAVYLLFRRSPFYALAYAANDIVLIVLWAM
ncbi:MAG: nicotinamide riboside transporter PnuC, partial [Oscillospiraceae bacterium]|nr:nicotinamide riboside transporter PnuC [Oscillospiraceae bacterium]